MQKPIWNLRRKWMGNLIPMLYATPFLLLGAWLGFKAQFALSFVALGLAFPAAFTSIIFHGLHQNQQMQAELRALKPSIPDDAEFVGYSRPGYFSSLDSHQQVGFLFRHGDSWHLVSEVEEIKIPVERIDRVNARLGYHSLVGLGLWCEVTYTDPQIKTVKIESRRVANMLANKATTKAIVQRLKESMQISKNRPA